MTQYSLGSIALQVLGVFTWGAYALFYLARTLLSQDSLLPFAHSSKILLQIILGMFWIAALFYTPAHYYYAHFLFLTGLTLIIYTDILALLISSYSTLFLIPLGWLCAYHNMLYISLQDSLLGTFFGWLLLASISYISFKVSKKEMLGAGDKEVLALSGSFTGLFGCWLTLLMGSFLASTYGALLLIKYKKQKPLAFGAFLALAAFLVSIFRFELASYLL